MTYRIILTVLAVHIALLAMIWGGISTLGCAAALTIPLVGCVACMFYELGWKQGTTPKPKKERRSSSLIKEPVFRG